MNDTMMKGGKNSETIINGFCMAIADSVPGVSGGTIAFIMGFYDSFIGSIHNVVYGTGEIRRKAFKYLLHLGTGWLVGMVLAVFALTSLFESHIYVVSSLFMGFILGAIPIIVKEEMGCIRGKYRNLFFLVVGLVSVAGITYLNAKTQAAAIHLEALSIETGLKMFFIGMIAVSAMFLPGISGSTLLLIFGAYTPIMEAIREVLQLHFGYVPALCFFGSGILFGALTVVKGIQFCLKKYRSQTVYCILGMMIGSLYAVMMGPATLENAGQVLGPGNFNIPACMVGVCVVIGLEIIKFKRK